MENLEHLRVAELREYAAGLNLDTTNLKKAEIIDLIKNSQLNEIDSDYVETSEELQEDVTLSCLESLDTEVAEVSNLEETEVESVDTLEEVTAHEAESAAATSVSEDISKFPYMLELNKAVMIYDKMDAQSSGKYPSRRTIEVLDEIDGWLYVEAFVSGLGYTRGYVVK